MPLKLPQVAKKKVETIHLMKLRGSLSRLRLSWREDILWGGEGRDSQDSRAKEEEDQRGTEAQRAGEEGQAGRAGEGSSFSLALDQCIFLFVVTSAF